MLLWVVILTLFSALVALFGRNLPLSLKANVLAVQGWISRLPRLHPEDLEPLRAPRARPLRGPRPQPAPPGCRPRDPSAAALSRLCRLLHVLRLRRGGAHRRKIDAAWARWVRPWTLVAWIFLTAGISMGSYWAYYELGWGGWWFWDRWRTPPSCPGSPARALLHSAIVMEKREALKVWTVLLAILTFSLSLLGTFLVRSGVLTSVHAFAVDPSAASSSSPSSSPSSAARWRSMPGARRSSSRAALRPRLARGRAGLQQPVPHRLLRRRLVGTLYPLALETLTGAKISVGPPFFNWTFGRSWCRWSSP